MPKTAGMKAYVARKKAEADAALTPEKFNALLDRLLPPGTYYNSGRRRFVPQIQRPAMKAGNPAHLPGAASFSSASAASLRWAQDARNATLPSFATGGDLNFGFTPQEIAGFGVDPLTPASTPAPIPVEEIPATTAPPAPQPAPLPVEEVPAIPATTAPAVSVSSAPASMSQNSGFTPQQIAGFGFPSSTAAQSAPPAPANPNHGFTQQQLAGFCFPPEASPQPQPIPGSEFTPVEVQQFGDSRMAALSDEDIRKAITDAEAERLAALEQFERNFGPIVAQEQVEAAERRQREQFEKDFGGPEAEAEQERLTNERLQRGQLEQFRKEFPELHAEELAELSVLASHEIPEAFPGTESSYFPVIAGTHEEYKKQGLKALRRHGWDGFADLVVELEIEFDNLPAIDRPDGPQYDPDMNRSYYDETLFPSPARELRNVQPVGSDSAINGVPAHEMTHGVREFLHTRVPEALELLEHGAGGAGGNTTITLDRGTPNERQCQVGGVAEPACRDLTSTDPAVREFAEVFDDRSEAGQDAHLFNYILERPGVAPGHLSQQVDALDTWVRSFLANR